MDRLSIVVSNSSEAGRPPVWTGVPTAEPIHEQIQRTIRDTATRSKGAVMKIVTLYQGPDRLFITHLNSSFTQILTTHFCRHSLYAHA